MIERAEIHRKIAEIYSMQRSIARSKKVHMVGVGDIFVRSFDAKDRLIRFHEWRIGRLNWALSSTEEKVRERMKMLWDKMCSNCRNTLEGTLPSKDPSPCRKDETLYFEYALLRFVMGEKCT
jgi:hypothetical protein